MKRFSIEDGERRHELGAEPLSLGSAESSSIRLAGGEVLEQHATVHREGERVVLRSLTPGEQDVRVNGVAVHAAPLQAGDSIRFGSLEATFEMDEVGARLVLPGGARELQRGVNALGRDPATGVLLDHDSVSRKHAVVFILPSGQVVLRDLGSANGTFVRDRRLGEMDLEDGDEIRIGEAVLHLREEAATATPAVADAQAPTPPAMEPAGAGTAVGEAAVADAPSAATVITAMPTPAAEAPPGPRFAVELGGERRELGPGTLRIGRHVDCDLVIADDAQVSRHHAEIIIEGERAILRDLGSANGTRVDGNRVEGDHELQNGVTIGIGGRELRFEAEIPVTPFGQTVIARSSSGASVAAARGMSPGGSGLMPSDRESSLLALDLPSDADDDHIRKRYQELYTEFQMRLTQAPTPDLKSSYGRRLDQLRGALAILLPAEGGAGQRDLPALEPIEDAAAAAGSEAGPAAGTAAASPAGKPPQKPKAPKPAKAAKAAKPPKPPKAAREPGSGIPRSTVVTWAINTLLITAAVTFLVLGLGVRREARALGAEKEEKSTRLAQLEQEIPATQAAIEELSTSKGAFLASPQLKICNHSSRPLRWVWLHTTWFDETENEFRSFDTGWDTNYEYLSGDSIEPGATFSGEWVVGNQRIWSGQAIFFAALFTYAGEDVLRAAATPGLDGGCFPLNLDR